MLIAMRSSCLKCEWQVGERADPSQPSIERATSLVRFSHQFGGLMRKPLWTHEVASKVLRPSQNRAPKTTPVVQMDKPICTTASSRAFLIGDEKCGLR